MALTMNSNLRYNILFAIELVPFGFWKKKISWMFVVNNFVYRKTNTIYNVYKYFFRNIKSTFYRIGVENIINLKLGGSLTI